MVANCVVCHHAAGDPIPPGDAGTYDASGGGVALGHLDLAASVDAAYANLINEPAQGSGLPGFEDAGQLVCDSLDAATAGHIRVVPDAAAQSLLCLKLKAGLDGSTPPCGAAMPLAVPLTDGGIAFGPIPNGGQESAFSAVAEWINEGANP